MQDLLSLAGCLRPAYLHADRGPGSNHGGDCLLLDRVAGERARFGLPQDPGASGADGKEEIARHINLERLDRTAAVMAQRGRRAGS